MIQTLSEQFLVKEKKTKVKPRKTSAFAVRLKSSPLLANPGVMRLSSASSKKSGKLKSRQQEEEPQDSVTIEDL